MTTETHAQLKSFCERIERLEEEKAALMEDIKEIYSEAQAFGLDKKALKQVIKLRAMDADKRTEEENILHTYMLALGMK